jgi:LysR family transcriptional regulator, low CO2-responsive transcriptional regulator
MLCLQFMPSEKKSPPSAAPFDSRQLRILSILATEPSLSAAARRLHLSQSAISHALKNLEADAGVSLVERSERGAELTQAGQALARRAQKVFEQMELARDELERMKHWGTQRLRFGASSTACQYLLPSVLSSFSVKHPKCRVEVSAGDSASRLAALREGSLDVAIITHTGLEAADIHLTDLMQEELCLVSPPLVSVNHVLPFIAYQKGSSLSRDAMLWFDQMKRARPEPRMELESLEAIKAMVKLGLGYAILPSWVVKKEQKAKTLLVEKSKQPVLRTWSLATRRGHRPTLSEESWMAYCAQYIQNL